MPNFGKKKKGYSMQMGSNSGSCESTFREKDMKIIKQASGKVTQPFIKGIGQV